MGSRLCAAAPAPPAARARWWVALLATAAAVAAAAVSAPRPAAAAAAAVASPGGWLPGRIALPAGFFPEGIVAGRYPTFYVASLVTGEVYRGDFTHPSRGEVLVTLPYAKGLSFDAAANVLYVAGIDGGGYAVDVGAPAGSPAAVRHLRLPFDPAVGRSSINDVEVAPGHGVFFTDALAPRLLYVPPWPSTATAWVPLDGFAMDARANATNGNGLLYLPDGMGGGCGWAAAPTLLVGNFALAQLYAVALPPDGTATRVAVRCGLPARRRGECALPGEDGNPTAVMGGVDGMARHPATPRDVYVANPTRQSVTVVRLDGRCGGGGRRGGRRPSAAVVGILRDRRFATPTTLAAARGWLYAVNSRLVEVPPGVELADLASGDYDGWAFDVVRFGRLGKA